MEARISKVGSSAGKLCCVLLGLMLIAPSNRASAAYEEEYEQARNEPFDGDDYGSISSKAALWATASESARTAEEKAECLYWRYRVMKFAALMEPAEVTQAAADALRGTGEDSSYRQRMLEEYLRLFCSNLWVVPAGDFPTIASAASELEQIAIESGDLKLALKAREHAATELAIRGDPEAAIDAIIDSASEYAHKRLQVRGSQLDLGLLQILTQIKLITLRADVDAASRVRLAERGLRGIDAIEAILPCVGAGPKKLLKDAIEPYRKKAEAEAVRDRIGPGLARKRSPLPLGGFPIGSAPGTRDRTLVVNSTPDV